MRRAHFAPSHKGVCYFFALLKTLNLEKIVPNKSVVCKFGGSSVASSAQFRKIKEIIQSDPRRTLVVVSAPGKRNPKETKLTDLFYTTHDLALKGLDFSLPFALIRERYLEIVQDLGLKSQVGQDLDLLHKQLKEDAPSVTVDYLVSRGEFLCARIMAEFLGATFVDAYPLIRFDARHRVFPESYAEIAKTLSGSGVFVVPGFYGSDSQGRIKTFSRGGSDITGSIVAHACETELYENWTDVSGLLMADPRIIPEAATMDYVSYREIRELAYSGANVLHDEAIAPCRDKNIPIQIRNTNRPQDSGTIIGPPLETPLRVVTGIAGRKQFCMIHLEKSMMNKEMGFGRKVLGVLENHGLSYEHSPSGIDSMSIVLDQGSFDRVSELVLDDIARQMQPDNVKVLRDIALIATVGEGMAHRCGVAAKLFTALAARQINVRIIDQGSSELNILVGVEEKDFEKAIQAIYGAFSTL